MSAGFGDDFFSTVIDAAPDGILIVGASGRILLANRHASELFGYPHADLVRLSVGVEDVADLWALERANAVNARYHVLGGALSPL